MSNCVKYSDNWIKDFKNYPDNYFTKKYKFIKKFPGRGGGSVLLIKDKKSKKKYILKIFEITKKVDFFEIINEIYISCVLGKNEKKIVPAFYKFGLLNNINPYKKYNVKKALNIYPFIVIEYINNYITLQKYCFQKHTLKDKLSVIFLIIYYMHHLYKKYRYYHNDFHLNNIMLSSKKYKQIIIFKKKKYKLFCPKIKIIDFGGSSINKMTYSKKSPVFSFFAFKKAFIKHPKLIKHIQKYKNSNKSDYKHLNAIIYILLHSENIKVPPLKTYYEFLSSSLFNVLL